MRRKEGGNGGQGGEGLKETIRGGKKIKGQTGETGTGTSRASRF